MEYLSLPMLIGIYVFVFCIGSSIFSFLNVVIYRVPNQLNFIKGRSFCPTCKHELCAFDLIPIVSWVCLKGKCRYCGEKISPRYAYVEILGGFLAVLSVWKFGITLQAVLVFAMLGMCTVVALVDADTMEIPDGFVITIFLLGILAIWAFPEITGWERIIGFLCISVPMVILTLLIPGAFGGGDMKLMAAAGVFLGWKLNLLATFIAILCGGIYGIWLLVTKQKERKDHFAFGPFLCMGIGIAIFVGNEILKWYLQFWL